MNTTKLDFNTAQKQFNEYLNNTYSKVILGPYEYLHSEALLSVDQVAYFEGFDIWQNNNKIEIDYTK